MQLEDLVGRHFLSGVQFGKVKMKEEYYDYDPNTIDFILDGKVLSVIEDSSDGYRSSMKEIVERPKLKIKNKFYPVEVIGTFRLNNECSKNYIIDFIDCITGKIILSVGTYKTDDYYPSFISQWSPENMCSNSERYKALSPNIEESL
jgi:hypothetical protein